MWSGAQYTTARAPAAPFQQVAPLTVKSDAAAQAKLLDATREALKKRTEENNWLNRNMERVLTDMREHREVLRDVLTEHSLLQTNYNFVQGCYQALRDGVTLPEQKIQMRITEELKEELMAKERRIADLVEKRGHAEMKMGMMEREHAAIKLELENIKVRHEAALSKSALTVTRFLCNNIKNNEFHPEIRTRSYRDYVLNRLVTTADEKKKQHLINSYVTNGSSNDQFDAFVHTYVRHLPSAWYLQEFYEKCPLSLKRNDLLFFFFKTVECCATPSLIAFINTAICMGEVAQKSNISKRQITLMDQESRQSIVNFTAAIDIASKDFHEKLSNIKVEVPATAVPTLASLVHPPGVKALDLILNPTQQGVTSFNLPDFTAPPVDGSKGCKNKKARLMPSWR
ncbi:ORF128 [Ranid herpesvirus 2]|uniref:ORF128 n=1 Tax=Ranid herpesvirus 2 TaxID=389214 RepID=Q14VX8_9VIRU|nr:ORF128 [Ranid herpesvirus 2]ABG25617.1 ORF128 [Ranid herpesvirus 2]